MIRNWW